MKSFYSKDEIKSAISSFNQNEIECYKSADEIKSYVKKISKLFFDKFGIIPELIHTTKSDKIPFNFFRVREITSSFDSTLICEHSYKPVHLTKEIGRCNFPRHPVFYCSSFAMTSLIEVIKTNSFRNKKYCISKWKIKKSNEDILLLPFLFKNLQKNSSYNLYAHLVESKISEVISEKLSRDQKDAIEIYFEFLSKLFVSDSTYSLSATLAHRSLYANHNLRPEILLYPSVASRALGVNMAIHPNFVDKSMVPVRFYIIEIDNCNLNTGEITMKFLSHGNFDRSKINWCNFNPEDIDNTSFIHEDFYTKADIKQKMNSPK